MLANQPGRVAVLMLDVDHFKRINDNYGHAAGDQVLRCMGDALRDALLASDIFARLGGEEFCVVLGELTSAMPRRLASASASVFSVKPACLVRQKAAR